MKERERQRGGQAERKIESWLTILKRTQSSCSYSRYPPRSGISWLRSACSSSPSWSDTCVNCERKEKEKTVLTVRSVNTWHPHATNVFVCANGQFEWYKDVYSLSFLSWRVAFLSNDSLFSIWEVWITKTAQLVIHTQCRSLMLCEPLGVTYTLHNGSSNSHRVNKSGTGSAPRNPLTCKNKCASIGMHTI